MIFPRKCNLKSNIWLDLDLSTFTSRKSTMFVRNTHITVFSCYIFLTFITSFTTKTWFAITLDSRQCNISRLFWGQINCTRTRTLWNEVSSDVIIPKQWLDSSTYQILLRSTLGWPISLVCCAKIFPIFKSRTFLESLDHSASKSFLTFFSKSLFKGQEFDLKFYITPKENMYIFSNSLLR